MLPRKIVLIRTLKFFNLILETFRNGMKLKTKLIFFTVLFITLFYIFHISKYDDDTSHENQNFEGFNNVTGSKSLIVPNIIHFIQFDQRTIRFIHFICICSAFYNHNPLALYLHTNVNIQGKYFNILKKVLGETLKVKHLEKPSHVFGQKLSSVQHSADVARIKVLMKFGGIILDEDVFVIRSLNRFRHFEVVIGWPEDQNIGTQVIVSAKQARFLSRYLDLYHEYRPSQWYYNAGEAPTTNILADRPELVHRVKTGFGVENLAEKLYRERWVGWAERFTIHLLDSHKEYLAGVGELEEDNYRECECTISDMIEGIIKNLEIDGIQLGDKIQMPLLFNASLNRDESIMNFILSDSKSLLHKYLTKERFDELKSLKTASYKASLFDVISSGLAHPDSHLGVYAPDVESYTVFRTLFDPVIRDYHQVRGRLQHPQSDWEDKSGNIGKFRGDFVKSTRIRIARNLEGYPLNSKMSKQDYLMLEKEMRDVFETLTGELAGTYLSLSEMTPVDHERLVSAHLMFGECDEYLTDGGACQHWPHGRGIFLNKDRSFVVWVGEEDHLRIISIESGSDLASVFQRLGRAVSILEKKLTFARNPSLGFLTYCPSNLGTTLRASVHISLPHVTTASLRDKAGPLGLQVRGAGGEHTDTEAGGVWDLSNVRRLGVTETELVRGVYSAVTKIIDEEEKLT